MSVVTICNNYRQHKYDVNVY